MHSKSKILKFTAFFIAAIMSVAFIPALLGNDTILAGTTHSVSFAITTRDEYGNNISETGGYAIASKSLAEKGETIHVFTNPNPGFVVDSVEWGNGLADSVNITGSREFTMPDYDVVVDVVFKKQDFVYIEWLPGDGGTGTPVLWKQEPGTDITLMENLPSGWTAPSGTHLIGWKIVSEATDYKFCGMTYRIISEATMTAVYGNCLTGWEDTGDNGVEEPWGIGSKEIGLPKTGGFIPGKVGEVMQADMTLKDGYSLVNNEVQVVGAVSNKVYSTIKMTQVDGTTIYYGDFTMPTEDVILRFATKKDVQYESYPQITSGKAHIQDIGDVTVEPDSETGIITLGTTGQGKRIEQITINFSNPTSYSGTLQYRVHVQDIGWTEWVDAGKPAGTTGQGKRIEAIEMRLTGELAENYTILYQVHIQDYGYAQGWVKDGTLAGTTGESKRIEEVSAVIIPKGYGEGVSVKYRVHVQDYGWESSYASDGAMSGTSGQSKRLEGIEIFISGSTYSGGIKYKTHVQDYGWESSWSYDGEMSGTQGQSKRLEGISIELYGEIAQYYDIYYRVHAQDIGWLSWACNGDYAGTAGRSARLEGIQIVLVPKGSPVPGETYQGITSVSPMCFVEGFDAPVG